MKICVISNLYTPYERGGAERVVQNIIKGLKDRGHNVFLITAGPFKNISSLRPQVVSEENLRIYRFYPLNLFFYHRDAKKNVIIRFFWHILDVFNWHTYFAVKKILKKEKPGVVMTHNLMGLGFFVPKVIKSLHLKHIHTLHDAQLATPSGLIIKGKEHSWEHSNILTKLYAKINKKFFGSPAVIISPSNWLLEFYERLDFFKKSKKIVLPNPIPNFQFPISNFQFQKRKEFNFLYLGQIEKHKGVLFLIKVFKKLAYNTTHNLHIAGRGSELERIKEVARDDPQIKIHGFIPHNELNKIFAQVDITIVPSLCYENSPTVIYESFSWGIPAIASRIGGVAELVKDGYNGFTFEAGDEKSLLEILKYCLKNRDKLEEMRGNAKKSAEKYGIEEYIKKLESM